MTMTDQTEYAALNARVAIPSKQIELQVIGWPVGPQSTSQKVTKKHRVGEDWRNFFKALRHATLKQMHQEGPTWEARWTKLPCEINRPLFDKILAELTHARKS